MKREKTIFAWYIICSIILFFYSTTAYSAPPKARAGPNRTVLEGDLVTLDGSNSFDPDDGIASYLWEQTAGISVTLSSQTAVQPTFTAPDVAPNGTALTFQLTVTDHGGLQDTDTCIINVTGDNDPPVADAGPYQEVDEGDLVTLDGSNSFDPDDGIASYLWEQNPDDSVKVTLDNPQAIESHFTAPGVGPGGVTFTFALTATDHGGLQDTDNCIINVTWDNIPPVADAGDIQEVKEETLVTLDGSKSIDPDDGIASYLWEQTAGISVTLSSQTAVQPTFTAPDVATSGAVLTFQLTVTDNGGLQNTDTCVVNVTGDNDPPVADAGNNQHVEEGITVILDGSGSYDPDDGIDSYLWEQLSGTPVTFSSTTDTSPTFIAPDSGSDGTALSFQLTVTDTGGLQGTDTCVISVIGEDPVTGGGGVSGCYIATAEYVSILERHRGPLTSLILVLLLGSSLIGLAGLRKRFFKK